MPIIPVKTYAIGFDGGAAEPYYSELPYAREVARRFGTEHHEIVVKPDVVALLPKLAWRLDEPVADPATVTTYLVSEFARRDVTVILSGVGRRRDVRRLPALRRAATTGRGSVASRGRCGVRLRARPQLAADRHSPILTTRCASPGLPRKRGAALRGRYRCLPRRVPRRGRGVAAARACPRERDALADAFARARSTTSSTACSQSTRPPSYPTTCCCSPIA